MGTDALNLQIGEHRVRVVCEDPAGISLLRTTLKDHVTEHSAPTGFVLRQASGKNKLHILLDRSGFVLGRARTTEKCLGMLGEHLAALLAPPPGTIRLHMRALTTESGQITIVGFPMFSDPPVTERRLERESHRIVDRLAIDIDADGGLNMTPSEWPMLSDLRSTPGHCRATDFDGTIGKILLPGLKTQVPSKANVIHSLVSAMSPHVTSLARLEVAETLASNPALTVGQETRLGRYEALGS